MPNKTKETKKEVIKETEKISQIPEKKGKNETKKAKKKNTSAKEIAVKVAETIKEASKKIIGPKEKNEKKQKKDSKNSSKKATSKPKIDNTKNSSTTKKAVTKKEASNITISKAKNVKSTYKQTKTNTKKSTTKPVTVIENYELPYRYNETIVRILYQTPNTLFVYWDLSDKDREKYIKKYGEDFFNNSYPVLIIHNDTMNYSFEISIDDFANSWYLRVNDSKCNYRVELGRRLNNNYNNSKNNTNNNFNNNYVYFTMSNSVELPNDHILFKTNGNNSIKYRNVKTKQETNISIFDIIKNLPVIEKTEIPYLSSEILEGLYTAIYKNEDLSVLENLANPSSGGLSSSRMPHS